MDYREQLLGNALVREGLLTSEALEQARARQELLPARFEDVLIKFDFLAEKQLQDFLAEWEHLPIIDVESRALDRTLLERIPREVIEKHEVLPYSIDAERIVIATSDPTDYRAIEEIQFLTGMTVETALAPRSVLREKIERYYSTLPAPPKIEVELPLTERLIDQIADPTVAALADILLAKGVIDPEEWQEALARRREPRDSSE